jgi:hypothetical protein
MKHSLFTRRSLTLGVAVAAFALVPASSAAADSTASCPNLGVSQPFLSWKDSHWYSLMPGQTTAAFTGSGWVLSGGAKIATTTRADGTTGAVLDLPSGAQAVSPTICVTSAYPTARTMVRDVAGSEGVFVSVSYAGAKNQSVGQVHGQQSSWALSTAVNIHSAPITGKQPVQFTFVGGGKTSEFQIYNFYLDPRMCR